jgi:(p)ppGpp synthase/HD superfamily hydrolase
MSTVLTNYQAAANWLSAKVDRIFPPALAMSGTPEFRDYIRAHFVTGHTSGHLWAAELHRGQQDKAGACYILHPLRVMLDRALTTEEVWIVAVLHDTLEDCDISSAQLQ